MEHFSPPNPYTQPTLRVQAGVQAMLQLEVQPCVWQLTTVVLLSFGRQLLSAALPFKDGSVSSICPAGCAGTSLNEPLNSGSLQALTISAVDMVGSFWLRKLPQEKLF